MDITEKAMKLLRERGIEPQFEGEDIFVTIDEDTDYYFGTIDALVKIKKELK